MPKLDHLYIVTTAPRDAKLQKSVREISQKHSKAGDFRIDVLFWDDICNDLAKDEDVFFGHYPQFKSDDNPGKKHDIALWSELTTLLRSDGVIGFLIVQTWPDFRSVNHSLNRFVNFISSGTTRSTSSLRLS